MADPFGGVYALPSVIEHVAKADEAHRGKLEERLGREGISWNWLRYDGMPAQLIVDRSRLADLIVLSLSDNRDDEPLSIVADVAIHARAPVLAVPAEASGFDAGGTAVVAWNGALEAAHALRLALPMLAQADKVQIVTVAEDRTEFPSTDACEYLARHGIGSQLHEWPLEGRDVAEAVAGAAQALGGAYLVMGAYGHSRMREAVLGGVTRKLLRTSALPLLLGH
jgi:nucleotide-binding universal stress UspA family protein